jgi:hypothetical protein
MQKIVLPLVGLFAFALTLGGLLLFGKGGVSAGAEPFLQAIAARDFVGASNLRSKRFRDAVPQADFERFLSESKVGLYASGRWSAWRIANGVGTIEGEITTATGESRPLRIVMVKEDGQWRIDAIQPLRAGVASDEPEAALPTPIDAVTLVRNSTADFARSVMAADFAGLHRAAAPELQQQFSAAQLTSQFQAFIDNRIDLTPLEAVPPNLSAEPAIDGDGILRLVGYYPAEGGKVDFDYRYVYRYTGWRLISIQVNAVPDG